MPTCERVYSVLIVTSSEKFCDSLRPLLPESDFSPQCIVGSVNEAQRIMNDRSFDLAVINTPLPDDFGQKLAIDISLSGNTVAALFVKNEIYGEVYQRVFQSGVMTLRKPISTATLSQSFDWMRSFRERLRKLEKKTVSLEEKMSEIRIVNRAKWALIDSCKMTESDAHKFIEKQAMDRCVTRKEIAEYILQTYGVK